MWRSRVRRLEHGDDIPVMYDGCHDHPSLSLLHSVERRRLYPRLHPNPDIRGVCSANELTESSKIPRVSRIEVVFAILTRLAESHECVAFAFFIRSVLFVACLSCILGFAYALME